VSIALFYGVILLATNATFVEKGFYLGDWLLMIFIALLSIMGNLSRAKAYKNESAGRLSII
jgi:hypothetical protein